MSRDESHSPSEGLPVRYRLIACEEHFTLPEIVRHSSSDAGTARPRNPYIDQLLDVGSERLRAMDDAGVDLQILSLATPGVQRFDPDTGAALARLANDRLADIIAANAHRFSGLAVFAPQAPHDAAREIERSITKLGLKGVVVHSHTNGEYLDDPKFGEIFEAIDALNIPLYLHPRDPSENLAGPAMNIAGFRIGWSYGVETATHALRLIAAGVFDRFPRLRIVLGHMGETLPFAMPRIDERYRVETTARGTAPAERMPGEYFQRHFLITTSGLNSWPQLKMTIDTHGIDNVLFAVDYPFEDMAGAVESVAGMPMDGVTRAKLCGLNAARAFALDPP